MEIEEHVVIAGAGVAGLAVSLGLHRLGIRSLVLESSQSLRLTGFAFGFWSNAWRALEALGVAEALREKHIKLERLVSTSTATGLLVTDLKLPSGAGGKGIEARCVNRKVLLEILANELPEGTIRFSSKVVGLQVDGPWKSILLADGTTIKTRVLIGADGVNSAVAKHLGFSKPVSSGRSAVRGFVEYEDGHGFGHKFMQFLGSGVRFGIVPSNDRSLFWFCSYIPSSQDEKDMEHDPAKIKEFVLKNLGKVTDNVRQVFEKTELEYIISTELKFRPPWELLFGNIHKDNVCVIGDALHPMTPDIGQGACCALEDSVVLARCLGEALKEAGGDEGVQKGLEKFAKERRWRSCEIVTLAYLVGRVQQGGGVVRNFLRDKFLGRLLMLAAFSKVGYDCGELTSP